MRLRFSFEIRLDRNHSPDEVPATEVDMAPALAENAAEHIPFGFTPNPATIGDPDEV